MKMDINIGGTWLSVINIDIDQVYRDLMKNNWHFIALLFRALVRGGARGAIAPLLF